MKKFGIICMSLICLFAWGSVPVSAREAFTIEKLDISMQVEEDGTYTVEERYTLDFTSERHGFYRTIPTKYEMKWTDADTGSAEYQSYYFPIDHISCGKASMCDVNTESGSVMIKIGDPDKTVIGEQHYTISYQVHTRDLRLDDRQMLYWNLVGNGFDTTIRNMSYSITMPKSFDANQISAYTGAYGAAYENLSVEVNGNTITGELLEPLYAHESATIMVPLDQGYFIFPPTPDYVFYAIIGSAVILLVALLLFYRFGKDDDLVVTVEFKAPDGLDSAGVGYVADAMVDNKDILSLIIDWANRGYIMIHEEADDHIKLEKRKAMEVADTTPYERTFFEAIFKEKDLVDEEDLKDAKVGEALSAAKTKLSNYFHTKQRRVFMSSSRVLQFFMCLLVALPAAFCAFAVSYVRFGMVEMSLPSIIMGILGLVLALPWIFIMSKRYVMKKRTFFLSWGICFLANGILYATVAIMIFFLSGVSFAWLYAILYLAIEIILLFILMFMDKRTKQGNRWLGQILGLRDFILTCEKDRLELLAEENPSAFFDILPYAYVLGVSDVWAKKFETIIVPCPEWYSSNTYYGNSFSTWIWWSSFHHSFRHMSYAASYVEPKSSGGFGGGSFGGGGGGGFSGGGFGGGGGGSW